ncbi:MAG: diguanylate cyclase [Rhodospirillaceae bacterium]|nr:diguanylate cyclase [Rhodospirillaceae bacterium]
MPAAAVERVLARDYAAVEVAAGWAEAREALAADTFDLAIVGGSAGGAAAAAFVRLLRLEPALETLPIVLAPHILTPETMAAAYAAGADAVIGPYPDSVLLGARLRHLLRQRSLIEELRLRERTSGALGIRLPSIVEAAPVPRRLYVLTDDGEISPQLRGALIGNGFAVSMAAATALGDVPVPGSAPELVLIDVSGRDPLAVAARLRQHDRNLPLALAHDARDPFRAVRALELGLAEPLPRPLDPDATAAALARIAERHAQLERLRRRYAESLDLAVTDSLTGAFNRRYLEAYFAVKERARESGAFALLLIDVDRFKDINDRLGHAGGDTALRQIAERLMQNVRGSDMVIRVGGEEFVVLMPGAERTVATTVAERLRSVIAERPFKVEGVDLPVTVSIGIAEGTMGPSAAALLGVADAALYTSKRRGRNCVTLGSPRGSKALSAPLAG